MGEQPAGVEELSSEEAVSLSSPPSSRELHVTAWDTREPRTRDTADVEGEDWPRRTEHRSVTAMQALKAQLRGGRLVLDEPTDVPEGEVVDLVVLDDRLASGDGLDDDERERLHRSIDRGMDDAKVGRTVDAREVVAALRARAAAR